MNKNTFSKEVFRKNYLGIAPSTNRWSNEFDRIVKGYPLESFQISHNFSHFSVWAALVNLAKGRTLQSTTQHWPSTTTRWSFDIPLWPSVPGIMPYVRTHHQSWSLCPGAKCTYGQSSWSVPSRLHCHVPHVVVPRHKVVPGGRAL